MTERHWSDELVAAVRNYGGKVLPIMALIMLLVGILVGGRATRRTLNGITATNFVIVVLLPLWMFTLMMELRDIFKDGSL